MAGDSAISCQVLGTHTPQDLVLQSIFDLDTTGVCARTRVLSPERTTPQKIMDANAKTCTRCGATKPDDEFHRGNGNNGRRQRCKDCRRIETASVPKAVAGVWRRKWRLKKDFRLTEAGYTALFEKQNGRCAICGGVQATYKTGNRAGVQPRLAVDHDHVTGHVRGLLCLPCNTGLGQFRDRPASLRAAAEYLERAAQEAATP